MTVIIKPSRLFGSVEAVASKSHAIREFLVCALSDGESQIECASVSSDIEAAIGCARALGAEITQDGAFFTVTPSADIPKTAVFRCASSAAVLRFCLSISAVLGIESEFRFSKQLAKRPNDYFLDFLGENGCEIRREDRKIFLSGKLCNNAFSLDGSVSSQFASGLLLALPLTGAESTLRLIPPVVSSPYLDMTLRVLSEHGAEISRKDNDFSISPVSKYSAENVKIEGDWSSASFLLSAGAGVLGLDIGSLQADRKILFLLPQIRSTELEKQIDLTDSPDLLPVLSVAAASAPGKTVFCNIGRLSAKESNRPEAIRDMISALGGNATLADGCLTVEGTKLCGGTVDSRGDHRIAMAAAVAAAKGDITILGAECTAKSYPEFWEDFAALGGKLIVK